MNPERDRALQVGIVAIGNIHNCLQPNTMAAMQDVSPTYHNNHKARSRNADSSAWVRIHQKKGFGR